MNRTEAFDLAQREGAKITHDSFDEGEYIRFDGEEKMWFDNEGDEILIQQFTGEFFDKGWEVAS